MAPQTASQQQQPRRQATSAEADTLPTRALRGDRLDGLTDCRRGWVWRSLLKGTRLEVARELAGLTEEQATAAVARVRRWYQQRLAEYKRQPRIRKPVTQRAPPRLRRLPAHPTLPSDAAGGRSPGNLRRSPVRAATRRREGVQGCYP